MSGNANIGQGGLKGMSQDYHDYVIKDGCLIAKFEEMYISCPNPWPESIEDMEKNCASVRAKNLINEFGFKNIVSVGSGKGKHLDWLRRGTKHPAHYLGVELSKTACEAAKKTYPDIDVVNKSIKGYFLFGKPKFDLVIFREVIWYILEDISKIFAEIGRAHKGKHLIIELSFYEEQQYGNEYYDGMEDFIQKFPFDPLELVRVQHSRNSNAGYLMVFGKI